MSHLKMSFQDFDLTTLLLNNHNGLKTQEILEMLDLFGLKIMFLMKMKFNFFILLKMCIFSLH